MIQGAGRRYVPPSQLGSAVGMFRQGLQQPGPSQINPQLLALIRSRIAAGQPRQPRVDVGDPTYGNGAETALNLGPQPAQYPQGYDVGGHQVTPPPAPSPALLGQPQSQLVRSYLNFQQQPRQTLALAQLLPVLAAFARQR